MHAHVGAVIVMEPATEDFGFAKFRETVEGRVRLAPRFMQKLRRVPFGLDRPYWVEDPDFDVASHLHRIAVPSPGSMRELADLVGDLQSVQIDRRKPLWEMWWIEGLEGGRVAVLAKTHHALIDGVSGMGLAEILCDLKPEPEVVQPGPKRPPRRRSREIGDAELFARGLWHSFGTPWRVNRYVFQALRRGLALAPFARAGSGPMLSGGVPKLRFNDDIGPRRAVAWKTIPLDEVRAIKKHFDVKVNDVVLSLCSGALRRYLAALDELPEESLAVSVPVSTRAEGDKEMANKVANMIVSWATDVADPIERLHQIHDNTNQAKEMTRAVRAREIQAMGDTVPPAVLNLAYRAIAGAAGSFRNPVNAVVSNVPGPAFPLYMAGGRIECMFPVSIIMPGMGLNVTVLSYQDRMDFGFTVDPELVADPWYLADGIPLALEELKDAAGVDHSVPLRPEPEGER